MVKFQFFSSSECDRSLGSKQALEQHLLGHRPSEEHLICDKCPPEKGKSFASKRRLDAHKKIHVPSKVECAYCKNKFQTSYNLNRHLKNCTKNPNKADKEEYPCDYCGTVFSTKTNLTRHQPNGICKKSN